MKILLYSNKFNVLIEFDYLLSSLLVFMNFSRFCFTEVLIATHYEIFFYKDYEFSWYTGLPLLYAIWSLPSLLPWNEMPLPVLPYFHAAATVCPWLGSSIYHLFMNHHSGYPTYERLLQWDVAGVWVTQSCGKVKWHTFFYIAVVSVFLVVSCISKILIIEIELN